MQSRAFAFSASPHNFLGLLAARTTTLKAFAASSQPSFLKSANSFEDFISFASDVTLPIWVAKPFSLLTLADVLAMLRLIRRVHLHVDDAKGHVNRNVDSRHKLHPGNYRRSAEKYRIISSIFQTLAKGSTSTLCRNRDTEANGRRNFLGDAHA